MENIDESKRILTTELEKILPIFINEFKEYISPQNLEYLTDKNNISNIIQFSNQHIL